jgi:ATP-dependent DNA helicase RecG
MRPSILFPLFAAVTTLPGVGPRLGKLFERLAGAHVVDLCWHLPVGLIDRRFTPKVADAPDGGIATLTLRVDEHIAPRNRRLPYRVVCSDETSSITLVFFHAKGDYLERQFPVGSVRVVSGKVERYRGEPQITHPDHVVPFEDRDKLVSVGWLTTNCSPISSASPWFVPICGSNPGARLPRARTAGCAARCSPPCPSSSPARRSRQSRSFSPT